MRDLNLEPWVELDSQWVQDVVSCVPDVLDLIWPGMVVLSEEVTEVTLDLVTKARFNSFQVKSSKLEIIQMLVLDQPRAHCRDFPVEY